MIGALLLLADANVWEVLLVFFGGCLVVGNEGVSIDSEAPAPLPNGLVLGVFKCDSSRPQHPKSGVYSTPGTIDLPRRNPKWVVLVPRCILYT